MQLPNSHSCQRPKTELHGAKQRCRRGVLWKMRTIYVNVNLQGSQCVTTARQPTTTIGLEDTHIMGSVLERLLWRRLHQEVPVTRAVFQHRLHVFPANEALCNESLGCVPDAVKIDLFRPIELYD